MEAAVHGRRAGNDGGGMITLRILIMLGISLSRVSKVLKLYTVMQRPVFSFIYVRVRRSPNSVTNHYTVEFFGCLAGNKELSSVHMTLSGYHTYLFHLNQVATSTAFKCNF
ncbi:hypothetical protein L1987_13873 [Smallanthus sonchifolius]|uniref:Uncharacterized protein n=1 Tax=Smallanthus sonchifolius TaxID=185202 RepID=A0ACB9JL77_9ASTR|nr:hypothetical protein L1987_13873 [Smallanthus sonchifolius]